MAVIPCAAQREAVRCRHGIATIAVSIKIPFQRTVTLCRGAHGMTRECPPAYLPSLYQVSDKSPSAMPSAAKPEMSGV